MSDVIDKPKVTPDLMAEKYIALREYITQLKRRQAEELAQYTTKLDALGNIMLDILNQARVESMRTKSGTFFKSMRTSCRVEDWQATLAYIREHEAYDLLEARVSKTAAAAIVEDTGAAIPGVAISQEVMLNVRRPSER